MDKKQWSTLLINRPELRNQFSAEANGPLVPKKGNQREAERLFDDVRNAVTQHPDVALAFSPSGYHAALDILQKYGATIPQRLREFIGAPYVAQPLVVYQGLQEIALNELDIRFVNPARTEYADSLRDTTTTKVITAYPQIGNQPLERVLLDKSGKFINK